MENQGNKKKIMRENTLRNNQILRVKTSFRIRKRFYGVSR